MTTEMAERLLERTTFEPNTGCWLWMGGVNGAGYGVLALKGRNYSAHRISYERQNGHIPAGLHLDHLCRMPCCVNPDHLEPVTPGENQRRGVIARHGCIMSPEQKREYMRKKRRERTERAREQSARRKAGQ